jgi:hypothetical protein
MPKGAGREVYRNDGQVYMEMIVVGGIQMARLGLDCGLGSYSRLEMRHMRATLEQNEDSVVGLELNSHSTSHYEVR